MNFSSFTLLIWNFKLKRPGLCTLQAAVKGMNENYERIYREYSRKVKLKCVHVKVHFA